MTSQPYRVFGDARSGNCYKVALLMRHLDIGYEWVPVDVLRGESRSAAFLKRNPNGRIPVLQRADGEYLAESNAILNYFAEGTDYLPDDRWQRARVLQWQFFEQYSHEPFIAVARFIAKFLGLPEERRQDYESKQAGGHAALKIMQDQLAQTDYLVGAAISIADLTLYAYTHVADEGGFDLSAYPAIETWLRRIASHPRHITMEQV